MNVEAEFELRNLQLQQYGADSVFNRKIVKELIMSNVQIFTQRDVKFLLEILRYCLELRS